MWYVYPPIHTCWGEKKKKFGYRRTGELEKLGAELASAHVAIAVSFPETWKKSTG